MSYTSGPWHWDSDPVKNDPTGRVRYRVTAVGKTITQVYYSSHEGGPTNAEDDAKLIAAAPDLLAMLEEIVAADEAAMKELELIGIPTDKMCALTNKSRAAIAKAKGQTCA